MRLVVALLIAGCGDNLVFDPGCPPGTVPSINDICELPGVPPTLCAIGWQSDGDAGCAPILPAVRCPSGMLAVPGEADCHSVSPCGAGTWGDIPLEPTTTYVDGSYLGTDSDGTIDKPWRYVQYALNWAPFGGQIAIAAGEYAEQLTAYRPLRIWGVCPERVVLASPAGFPGPSDATLRMYPYGANSELHGLSIGGAGYGLVIDGTDRVTLDHMWFRDSATTAVAIQDDYYGYQASVVVYASLFESGITLAGQRLELEDVAVRGGAGIKAAPGFYKPRSSLEIRNSVIEDTVDGGILVIAGDAIIHGVVVRGTQPSAEGYGTGIAISGGSLARVTQSLLEANHDAGIAIGASSQATLEGLVVRGTRQRAVDRKAGHGIAISGCPLNTECDPELRTSATVRQCLIEDNEEAGISVTGADATIDRVLVRKTLLGADGKVGDGILVLDDGVVATATVTRTRSEDNVRAGMASFGGSVTLGASLLSCNSYDLATNYSELLDLGSNRCGCADLAACIASHDDLDAPIRSW